MLTACSSPLPRARRQISRTGEEGGGLAKAGLILGYVGLAMVALPLARNERLLP